MKTRNVRRRARKGFTLLELLLVMAILVVLAGATGFAYLRMQSGALSRAAFNQIKTLERACTAYKIDVGTFPQTLDDLYTLPSGMNQAIWLGPYIDEPVPLDPWQRKYTYTADDVNDRVSIRSVGKDGQQGTQDDIPQQGQ